ncbi:unnamed protein product [Rhizophagus irregularis]|nr:unnamed protein product [Rhizophagus irregularis]
MSKLKPTKNERKNAKRDARDDSNDSHPPGKGKKDEKHKNKNNNKDPPNLILANKLFVFFPKSISPLKFYNNAPTSPLSTLTCIFVSLFLCILFSFRPQFGLYFLTCEWFSSTSLRRALSSVHEMSVFWTGNPYRASDFLTNINHEPMGASHDL